MDNEKGHISEQHDALESISHVDIKALAKGNNTFALKRL